MNSTEIDGDGGRGVKAGEEIDQKTESGQNVKEIKDQNGGCNCAKELAL